MKIPEFVLEIIEKLQSGGQSAYLVGGCVRDLLMAKEPKDWDIATDARPEIMLKLLPGSKYENAFGTVLVPIRNESNDVVEVTTYRSEQGYSDRRHPDEVLFEDKLEKDLERRDFTINAMALTKVGQAEGISEKYITPVKIGQDDYEVVDLFGGADDLKKKIIRAVGEPSERFKEDALRMLRAIRFSCQLNFEIEPKTERAILKLAGSVKFVSGERIRDELVKILSSDFPSEGIMRLYNNKLLQYILPELEAGVNVKQHYHHIYTVFKHNILSLKYCPNKSWPVRLAALLHDVGKPKSAKTVDGHIAFYNHEYIGAKMTEKIMKRLKFSNEDLTRVVNLVRNHMFYYNVGEVSAASVRRLIVKTGKENLSDLIDLRIADRLGSGLKNEMPYKLRHLQYMMEKVQNDPLSVKMLQLNGSELMSVLKVGPGPKIGAILEVLLSEVLEDPELNTKEYLSKRSIELDKLDLEELRVKAQEVIAEKLQEEDQEMKRDFKV
ncbi:MAG: HD domain-containing protein [Patescibacteria group bacterium]